VATRLGGRGRFCAGGRLPGWGGWNGANPAPAGGWPMGSEPVLALLREDGVQSPPAAPDVYLAHQGETADVLAGTGAEALRDAGLEGGVHCGGGSFKAQGEKADSRGAACAGIIGDDEAAASAATLKPLRGGAQQLVALADLAQQIFCLKN